MPLGSGEDVTSFGVYIKTRAHISTIFPKEKDMMNALGRKHVSIRNIASPNKKVVNSLYIEVTLTLIKSDPINSSIKKCSNKARDRIEPSYMGYNITQSRQKLLKLYI